MSKNDEEILVRELAKLGELGGRLGGAGEAGAQGARFAAKFLPTETYTEKITLAAGPEKALKLGFSVLNELGELQTEQGGNTPYPLLKAVVRSGFLNMNPAVVYLVIVRGDSASCEISVSAAAKEGLIKQHTARKAVQRVISALRQIA